MLTARATLNIYEINLDQKEVTLEITVTNGDHSFTTYTTFSEKLRFLISRYVHVRNF